MSNNLTDRYPFASLKEGTFFFVTDYGCYYSVEFSNKLNNFNGHPILNNGGQIYEISFACTGSDDDKKIQDPAIAFTILFIMSSNILSKGDTSTYYFVCDTTGGMGKARAKLFEKWFAIINQSIPKLEKYNFIIPGFENDEYDVSLLIFGNHPLHDEYIAAFEATLSEDFTKW